MSTINTYFAQVELSQAAYGTFAVGAIPLEKLTGNDVGMSATQAERFKNTYTVLAQSTPTINGFSATLFLNNQTGEKTLAIQGTNSLADLATDFVDVLILGGVFAQEQYASLNGFYQQLIAQGALTSSETFSVSGHSLGGFLAQAFSVDHPSNATQTYTYNAPGIGGGVAEVLSWLGATNTNIAAANIINIQASGPTVIAGLGTLLGNVQSVSAEGSPHSIVPLTDSLALYNIFATLDPTLDSNPASGIQTITNILKASSNIAANTLESTVSALGELFLVNGAAGYNGNEFDGNRDLLYTALNDIGAAIAASGGGLTLRDLTAFGAAQIASVAQNNLAYRYALVNGNPFALVGNDAVYAQHNNNGELDLFNPATRTGTLTDQYLKDRSAFLVDKNLSNTQDNLSNGMGYVDYAGAKQYFRDEGGATPTTVVLGGGLLANQFIAQLPDDIQQIRFGSDTVIDTLQGGSKADHLYGMSGDDTLQGGLGNDYLEGGQGADTYVWNTGDGLDTLLDTDGLGGISINGLTLGAGETQDGGHTYTSTDANNIKHTYTILSGDINAAGGATLLIDNAVKILNYHAGDLGLTLNDAAPPQPIQPTTTITGDILPDDIDPAKTGIQAAADANGNPIGQAWAYADILGGTAGNDHILSGELNDDVGGGAGDDHIEGGAGNDYLHGGAGNDIVEGGTGSDIVAGEDGNDRLFANAQIDIATAIANGNPSTGSGQAATGLKGDWLAGGSGDDTLVSGADNDVLSGGEGSDLLIAGAGDDYILGDADYIPQFIPEADPRYQIGNTNWFHSSAATFDWSVTDEADGGALFQPIVQYAPGNSPAAGNDIIYAGDGADHVWAGSGADVVYGEGGADKINGDAGNDILFGGAGGDTLWGAEDDDYLDGGEGDDLLFIHMHCIEAANDAYYRRTEQHERRAA